MFGTIQTTVTTRVITANLDKEGEINNNKGSGVIMIQAMTLR